uniref:Uncharacterized protein n=1 Tax=Mus musculus TaxID=10090 RepID=Q8BNP4_MOUSE|nr:unnamed protein product [Mus musculus]
MWILTDGFPFSSRVLVARSSVCEALWSPFIPAGLPRRRGAGVGGRGLGNTAAAGCELTMVAMSSCSLRSTALPFLFKFIVKVFCKEEQNKTNQYNPQTKDCVLLAYFVGKTTPSCSLCL